MKYTIEIQFADNLGLFLKELESPSLAILFEALAAEFTEIERECAAEWIIIRKNEGSKK